jgi:hypothetical protein
MVTKMNINELEHIIRAACAITGEDNIVIIGSQAILASFPNSSLPEKLTQSIEADVFYLNEKSQELTDLIDGTIGELSIFQDTFGVYAHGVGKETAILPKGWESRLVKLKNENTYGYTGLCLDPYDLCVSKLFAHRKKDLEYVSAMLKSNLLEIDILRERINSVSGNDEKKQLALTFIRNLKK